MPRRPEPTRPYRVAQALTRWLVSRKLSCWQPGAAWNTESGATLAIRGRHAVKLASLEFPYQTRVALAQLELATSLRLPRQRRIVIGILWFNDRTSTLQCRRSREHSEPCLWMHRLAKNDNVPTYLSAKRKCASRIATDFGSLLATYHRNCRPVRPQQDPWPAEAEELGGFSTRLLDACSALALALTEQRLLQAIAAASFRWLNANRLSLKARADLGMRRDGHGDLHCDNLYMWRGHATLLDPLPFYHYRVNDVTNDLGRLAFEFHRLSGSSAREALLEGYALGGGEVRADLVNYFEGKSLLIDVIAFAKRQHRGQADPSRKRVFMNTIADVSRNILALQDFHKVNPDSREFQKR